MLGWVSDWRGREGEKSGRPGEKIDPQGEGEKSGGKACANYCLSLTQSSLIRAHLYT